MTLCLLFCKQVYSLHIHWKYLITTLHIYCSCLLCNAYCSIWLILGYNMHASQHFCCGEVDASEAVGTGFLDCGGVPMKHNDHIFQWYNFIATDYLIFISIVKPMVLLCMSPGPHSLAFHFTILECLSLLILWDASDPSQMPPPPRRLSWFPIPTPQSMAFPNLAELFTSYLNIALAFPIFILCIIFINVFPYYTSSFLRTVSLRLASLPVIMDNG